MARPLRLVLIEDNPPDVYWLTHVLEELREIYNLQHYSTAICALERMDSWKTSDLLLLDWYLPDMNGDEFLSEFRKTPQFTAVPVAQFIPLEQFHRKGQPLGARWSLTKPVDAKQLGDLFQELEMERAAKLLASTCDIRIEFLHQTLEYGFQMASLAQTWRGIDQGATGICEAQARHAIGQFNECLPLLEAHMNVSRKGEFAARWRGLQELLGRTEHPFRWSTGKVEAKDTLVIKPAVGADQRRSR